MDRELEQFQELVDRYDEAVFFGGAGVSTESGIPDFRSEDGLYRQKYKVPPETVISHSFFVRHTETFFEFYKEKMLVLDAKPNEAHKKLAEMEQKGRLRAVVTQNIDGLHQAAGSRRVYELHGSIHRNYCMDCGAFYDGSYVRGAAGIPRCGRCGGIVKPDVVLYEEALDSEVMKEAVRAIAGATLMIVGGTSLAVYPAAGLLRYFQGKALVLLNRGETPLDSEADLCIRRPIGEVMAQIRING